MYNLTLAQIQGKDGYNSKLVDVIANAALDQQNCTDDADTCMMEIEMESNM